MKKLLTKFTSIFLAVVVLMSCYCVPVSAEEDALLTSFGSVPLGRKSDFLTDDGYVYKYCFLVRLKSDYKLYMFGKKNYDSSIDDISYLNLSSSTSTYYCNSDGSSVKLSYAYLSFKFDSTFNVSNVYGSNPTFNTGYYYAYGGSTIENFVDNIIYSDFPVKYNGLTVYDPSKNKHFTIEDFISLGTATPDDPNFVGPLPVDIDGDGVAPYNYFLSPVEGTAAYDDFINWLIENEKYKDLSSFGLSCTADNLRAVVKFWSGNYNNVSGFLKALNSMWSTINALNQAKNIYSWLQQQWELYKKSLITYEVLQGTPNSVLDTSVDYDEDGNFISSETAYLKLILGTLFSFFNNFNTFVDNIYNFLSSINNNIYQIVNYIGNIPKLTADYIYNDFINLTNSIINSINCIPNTIYNNFLDPINQLLDAVNNIGSGSSVTENITNNYYTYNTEIADSEYDEFDAFFTEYNQKYDEIIKSKFPFINQVQGIFDEVWKACGYTETSEPQLQTMSTTLNSAIGPQQTQQDKVNSAMSSIFPKYDSSYLNSADVSNAPSFNINIAGSEVSIIDFRIFDKYRSIIHAIITCCMWIPYLWSLLKSVPGIIANVGDVRDISIRYDLYEYKAEMKEAKFVDIPISHDHVSGINVDALDGVSSVNHEITIPDLDDNWSKI